MERLHFKTYRLTPEAPWIVFLHGAGGSIQTWDKQVDTLSQHYNLLLIDLRDHGESKNVVPGYNRYNFDIIIDDLYQVLQELGIRKAHFVTLSFGSVLIQALYQRHPLLIDRMVLIGGVFNANWGIKGFVHLARFFNLFLSFRQMYRIFSYLLMPRKNHQVARRVYQMQAQKMTQNEYVKWLGLYSEFFLLLKSFNQQTLQNPLLILMGTEDYLFLPSARKFSENRNNAQLKLIDAAGHICNIEKPEAVNQSILDFLGTHKAPKEIRSTSLLFETS